MIPVWINKDLLKTSATVVGTLRYEVISVEEGASVYSDLHCTKADQKLVDKISHLKKTMNQSNLSILTPSSAEEYDNPEEETSKIEKEKKNIGIALGEEAMEIGRASCRERV